MKRRAFIAAGLGAAAATPGLARTRGIEAPEATAMDIRAAFPRLRGEAFLNAAGGAPLGSFAEAGISRYVDDQKLGPADGRGAYVARVKREIHGRFASLIGAREPEIGLVHCTKAGEQIVLDGLVGLRDGGNVVTNDLHFSGSLNNLVGLRAAGLDVRIVRAVDWRVRPDDMAAAIDDRTALVAVTLVSNVNGHIEALPELSEIAHARGALVYADIIQAAGIVPIDVRALGIDFAACSAYKWLYGLHGTGFLYVAEEHQGTALADRMFPGHVRYNYAPWIGEADVVVGAHDHQHRPPVDATRYQPGHPSYLGYCAAYEALGFLEEVGIEAALAHSVRLNRRLVERLDPARFPCLTPDVDRSPIVTFAIRDRERLQARLEAANVVVSLGRRRMRVSPALYNTESDVDRLVEALA